jgi:hypothetical protein
MELLYVHPDMLKQIDTVRHREAMHRARVWRLGNQALGPQSGWVREQRCWLLCQLGRLLTRVGQQLEHYGAPQTV